METQRERKRERGMIEWALERGRERKNEDARKRERESNKWR